MLSFDWPLLFILLPLPLLVYMVLPALERQSFSALEVPFYADMVSQLGHQQPKADNNVVNAALAIALWLTLITAAARPMWVGDTIQLPNSGRNLMLAVDVSSSMEQQDLTVGGQQTDRLEAVKDVLDDFINRRESDRLGLILFGSAAYLHTPLTFDQETVRTFLKESAIGMAGPKTAIGDAIGLAVKRLQKRPAASRVLILLTDGANTAGKIDPLQAADLAAKIDLKVYTIGVGASEMEVKGPFGGLFGSRYINPSADLDEETLRAIAEKTGGRYFRAQNSDELAQIYQALDELEPTESEKDLVRPQQSLLHWPLSLTLLISLILAHRLR